MSLDFLTLAVSDPIPPPTSGWQIFGYFVSAFALILGGGAIFYVREMRRKLLAEAKKLEVEPEAILTDSAMKFVDRLEKRLRAEEAKSARLEEHVHALEDELRRHGITPPAWPPLKVVDDV